MAVIVFAYSYKELRCRTLYLYTPAASRLHLHTVQNPSLRTRSRRHIRIGQSFQMDRILLTHLQVARSERVGKHTVHDPELKTEHLYICGFVYFFNISFYNLPLIVAHC